MRIAIVSEFPLVRDRALGGLEAVVRGLAGTLARDPAHEVHVISFHAGLSLAREDRVDGVRVHRFPLPGRFGNLTFGAAERRVTIEALGRIRPHVVHALGLGPKALAAESSGVPWVVSINGIQSNEARVEGGMRNRLRAWACTRMERAGFRAARHVIVPNPVVRGLLGNRLAARRVWVIENSVEEEFFGLDEPGDPGRILCVGRVIPIKAPEILLEATRLLVERGLEPHVRFVGPADDPAYVEGLLARARALGIVERVRFLGFVPDDVLRSELGRASVLAHPSRVEIAPLSVMQAMAAGKPVVATDVGGTSYLLADGETGLLARVGDATSLAQRLARILEDPVMARAMGRAGRAAADRRFRIGRVVQETLAVYREIDRPTPADGGGSPAAAGTPEGESGGSAGRVAS